MKKRLPRIVCVVGPTSSGKTSLSLRLAKFFEGEVINADARQCYIGTTIGTGKPVGEWKTDMNVKAYSVQGIPHHIMDVLLPTTVMTVAEWRERAMESISAIVSRKHLPIVVGGTGLYIRSLVDNPAFPKVEPQLTLRAELEARSLDDLVHQLVALDPASVQEIDLKNKRRVLRALEVTIVTGQPFTQQKQFGEPLVDAFQIGVQHERAELYARIDAEIEQMLQRGWVDEVKTLLDQGISVDAPAMSAIGYRELAAYIVGQKTLEAAIDECKQAVHQYAKRQETWFKKDLRIHWATTEEEAMKMVQDWAAEA